MKKFNKIILSACLLGFSSVTLAQDILGMWQSIDDKTGAPKGAVKITKDENNIYTGTITKLTPRVGYTPKEFCVDCPAPFTNKPMIGLGVIQGLKKVDDFNYVNGKILDPNTGKIYSLKAKLSPNGKRLVLRGYMGVSVLGRSQTWIRLD
ncbi:DUF2147 domain-containing protein [Acinetobacter wuhouensis]|uniref:DUF2147 domain-containing protein n=1 Tax=Acinetobacter wuhouensis TaxID=1879050 RepID=A0A385C6I5_9GAMM|nr:MULTISPECIES: DUF2147 domain-containing protein [Acinetobacter]AXQ23330.1 DUF2147 domain-containing protein [Acinetobacter wuhouensis]AYO55428.1 DUF2147 domain-containing protein [Acinetobacter wuhouensis]RZG75434.1 DUF2147 domain-containing protein [Acinetobacter sp. WCHAc060025]RZG87224.1 DUF2147 domain-containing protein [Acinetobacter sp. WCHAc060033]